MIDAPILTIVVPCYNEEAVFQETARQLTGVMSDLLIRKMISTESNILFVDDGSKDQTWQLIAAERQQNALVQGLKLAHNVGHQNALFAGLEMAMESADCVISIDADLQDDINVISQFIEKFQEGYDIVYGVRQKRETDTFFKRNSALGFYRLMQRIGIHLIPNHADYRLMSKRALKELARYQETNLFLRGIVPMIGFPTTRVYYNRKERMAGESKYPLKKMLSFALDGITSFSISPIRMVTTIGFLSFLFSLGLAIYALVQKLLGHAISGWSSTFVAIVFFGSLQLLGIGIIGEYIGKIYQESKRRPRYAVETWLPVGRDENEPVLEQELSRR